MAYHFKIIENLRDLPPDWDFVVAGKNIFLSLDYFTVLENSKPDNMICYAVAFFQAQELIGGALFQHLDFTQHAAFQQNTSWCNIRNYLIKKFSRDILIVGNNMLTGQNGFDFNPEKIKPQDFTLLLEDAVQEFQKKIQKTSLILYKDFKEFGIAHFKHHLFKNYYIFSVQPNMILKIRTGWHTYADYIASFSKKYRDRAKTAARKFAGLEKHELDLAAIAHWKDRLHLLYHHVAGHAPFNTFFLTENHFSSLKENLKEDFRLFGYFKAGELVGFYTMICNKKDLDTYFLGYDAALQKTHQLYLNMLLDMAAFAIDHNFEKIILGRTALEIKSTTGAEPTAIFGLIRHNAFFINLLMSKLFPFLEPKVEWLQRKPFK